MTLFREKCDGINEGTTETMSLLSECQSAISSDLSVEFRKIVVNYSPDRSKVPLSLLTQAAVTDTNQSIPTPRAQ